MKLVPRKCLNMADVTDVITWWLKTGQIGTEVERCTIKGRASPNKQWTTETRWSGSNRVLQHSGAGCPTTTCCFKTLLMRILMWCHAHTWYNHRLHHVVVRWSVICVAATLFTLSNTVTIIVTHTNWMKQYCHVVGGYMSAKPITSSKGFRWTITCTIMLKNISI